MAVSSDIEWTEATWNPVTGCTKVSPGCTHCYAERMSKRLQAMGVSNYRNGFRLKTHEHMLSLPLTWRAPKRIFVNSMSDLFHTGVPESFIQRVFDVMGEASWHEFQLLTKRADRLEDLASRLPWPRNVWMGVSIETDEYVRRADLLRSTPAAVRFLSLEPLLGPVGRLELDGIDWVIVGGESGPHARPMRVEWVRDVRDRCRSAGVPFFFKQWGGVFKKSAGRRLDGRTWDQLPRSVPGEAQLRLRRPERALASA